MNLDIVQLDMTNNMSFLNVAVMWHFLFLISDLLKIRNAT